MTGSLRGRDPASGNRVPAFGGFSNAAMSSGVAQVDRVIAAAVFVAKTSPAGKAVR
ncbi:MAG TPA: hypothetical protein PLD10_24220 [Rhodopila sp.]|nr:hypothetical protein [Rhodopila sp.]